MKYLSVQTFQCGISVSGAATFTGGATINLLALNGATTSSEASLFLGAHGTNEGGQLVLQKGTSNTYAAHLDNYADQFRILYGTNTGSAGVALAVSLSSKQLILPAYTTTSSFPGTAVGYLAFDSAGNVITVASPAGAVTSIIAGTGVSVSSATGNVTVSIGQSVATSATPSFDQVFLTNNGNGTNVKIGDDVWLGDVNASNTLGIKGQQDATAGYITFGSELSNKLGRTGTGALTWGGNTIYHEGNLTNLSQLTNGPGYITSAALSGYVPTSRLITINGTSYDLSADRTWTINTVSYTSRLQHQVKAGVAINKGQAVYVTSADGTNMIVGLASNASEATSSKTMGLLDATVAINGFANVVTEGLLAGLDTSTAGTEGDPVWLGTGGNLIYGLANKPSAPAHLVFIGIVTRKNNSNGEIFVKVQNGFELNEIHDVDIKTTVPVNGHILGFDGTLWVNKTIAGWLGYTPANASGTTNYISKFTGSTTLGNSQIYDNGTNVGIGTATPIYNLEVSSVGYTGFGIMSGANNTAEIGFQNRGYGLSRWTIRATGAPDGSSGNLTFQRLASTFPLTITSNENLLVGTTTDAGYKLYVNGTGYFADNLKLQTGILSFDGVAGYWGNAIKYETGQLNLYQSGDLHLGVGGGNITLYKNTKIPHNQRFTAGGYSSTDGITIWGTQNASAGGDGFVGRNLYYNGTNYIYASTNDNSLWGTIAGMRVVGNSSNALEFIARPATNSGLDVVASDLDSYKRMVISYSGNVGIGTISPTSILDASVSSGATSGFRFKGWSDASTPYLLSLGTQTYQDIFQIKSVNGLVTMGIIGAVGSTPDLAFQTNSTERMRITSAGNVGIGTINPAFTLVVKQPSNSTSTGLQITQTDSAFDGIVLQHINGIAIIKNRNSGALTLGTNDTERFRITAGGDIGIGTTSPSYKLDINGSFRSIGTADIVSNFTFHRLNSANQIDIDSLDSFILSKTDGSYGSGTKPSGSHNGFGVISLQTHAGNYFTQLGLDTNQNDLWIRSANGTAPYGTWVKMWNTDDFSSSNISNWNTAYGWGNHSSAGYVPQTRTLTINGTSYDLSANRSWTIATTTPGGSDTQFQYNSSGSLAGASALTYNSANNRIGVNQASPGYDFDVNGQVRVQDKLRVGTVNSGNGVVHMSSSATINPNTTTIVWAQNVSVGMCAFIEYYILNNNSLTDQRAGTIMVTWNQSGTPTIAHTETTTPDIGSTTSINFTSSLVGSDARINAVNSSANPYTIVMSYKYF